MSNTRTKQIGEHEYEVTLFTTSNAIKNFRRLLKVIGPSMAVLFEGSNELSLDDTGPIAKAVSLLAENIDKDDVVSLIKDLLSTTMRNGQRINFDLDFMGKIGDLFKVVIFVVQENYVGFFDKDAFAQQ